jgi:TonB family protein
MNHLSHMNHIGQTLRTILLTAALVATAGLAQAEVRLSTADAMSAAVVKATPSYPVIAKQMRVTGKVEVEVTIDVHGNVSDIKMLSGNALFSQSVIDALKRWRFTPAVQDGAPATAVAVLSFTFNQ